jgi:hypothetical protein
MESSARVFVSYTQRDGVVTFEMLNKLNSNLQALCVPFIHAVESKPKSAQIDVIKRLLSSHLLILIVSPKVDNSPWVRFELFLAKIKLMPVIKLSASDVAKLVVDV